MFKQKYQITSKNDKRWQMGRKQKDWVNPNHIIIWHVKYNMTVGQEVMVG